MSSNATAEGTDKRAVPQNARTMYHQPEASPDLKHRLIAVAPDQRWVATALGTSLTIIQAQGGKVELPAASCHTECIQVLVCSADGKYLLTGSDDKQAKLWDTATWTCMKTVVASKKVSAGCFSHDGTHFLVGDRFGDVGVSGVDSESALVPFLGHFCAIITTLCADPQGRWVASGDRDGKLRVSKYPAEPMKGAWEICAYCMGHAACIMWAGAFDIGARQVLVTAGVDGQLNVWEPMTGARLAHLQVSVPAEADSVAVDASGAAEDGDDGDEDGNAEGAPSSPKVAALVACALNAAAGLIAVAVDGKDEVTLVHCTASEDGGVTLRVSGEHSVGGVVLPTRLAFAPDGALWVAGGPCSDAAKSVHVATCRLAGDGASMEQVPLPAALAALDVRDPAEDETAAAEAPSATQMKPFLRKKWTAEAIQENKAKRAADKEKKFGGAAKASVLSAEQGRGKKGAAVKKDEEERPVKQAKVDA